MLLYAVLSARVCLEIYRLSTHSLCLSPDWGPRPELVEPIIELTVETPTLAAADTIPTPTSK